MNTSQPDLREQQDREANEFAIALLMPGMLVIQEARKIGLVDLCDDVKMQKLAKLFGVSHTMMAIRIGQLMYKA